MLKTLGDEGYLIEWRVVNAAEYGFPQRRIRVFIVASKQKRSGQRLNPVTYLSKDGILARALPIQKITELLNEVDLREEADEISLRFNKGKDKSPFLNSGVYLNGIAYTVRVRRSPGGNRPVVPRVASSKYERLCRTVVGQVIIGRCGSCFQRYQPHGRSHQAIVRIEPTRYSYTRWVDVVYDGERHHVSSRGQDCAR
jgi:site-specific DNA-cytosine methylase